MMSSSVSETRVLPRPDGSETQPVAAERPADRVGHGFAVVDDVVGDLPEPAAVEVALGFLDRGVEQQELDGVATSAEGPEVEDVGASRVL
jgi:hypothetical protein